MGEGGALVGLRTATAVGEILAWTGWLCRSGVSFTPWPGPDNAQSGLQGQSSHFDGLRRTPLWASSSKLVAATTAKFTHARNRGHVLVTGEPTGR